MDIFERITNAIRRITTGQAPMRIPVENSDPDIVLADCAAEIGRLRAALAEKEKECEEWKAKFETASYNWGVSGVAFHKSQQEVEMLREAGIVLAMRVLQSDIYLDSKEWLARDVYLDLHKQALEGEKPK